MAKHFFTKAEQNDIIDAIKQAELNTSGEIRLHVEAHCKKDAYERAREVFEQLGMHATDLKNGVLFYIAYEDHKLAILGDKGIHEKVTQQFWEGEKELLRSYFKQNKYAEGLIIAINKAGEKLQAYFPYQKNDTNELSNDISFGGGLDAQ
jgi:uncharacterized membrane protein